MQATKELTIYKFQNFDIRVFVDEAGEPLWIAKDVCQYFGDKHYRRSIGRLNPADKGVTPLATAGGEQEMVTINEAGLYSLLFTMQPQRRATMSEDQYNKRVQMVTDFRRWVTHEVLPSIRKNGRYTIRPTESDELVGAVKDLVGLVRDLIADKFKGTASKALPAVRPLASRDQVGKVVRTYAKINRLDFQACWKELYSEFLYRYHIDLYQRAQAKGTTGVAIAEELGMIDDLLSLAIHLYEK